jgi:hypothetical protein
VNPALKPPPNVIPGPPQSHPGWVYGLRFTPDGKRLITVGNAPPMRGFLAVWNVADGQMVWQGERLDIGPIYSVAVKTDGKLLAISCGSTQVQASDAKAYLMRVPEGK